MGNMSLAKPVLAINAAGAATVKTTNALVFTVDGIQYTKAALAAQSLAPTHDSRGNPGVYVQPENTTVYYTLAVNKAGAIAVVQGSFAGQRYGIDPTVGVGSGANMGTSYIGDGSVPDAPDGYTPFGLIKVVTGNVKFTPGTTLLDAANVTATYFDIGVLPAVAP